MGDELAADRPAMVELVPAACRASSNKARFLRVIVDIWQPCCAGPGSTFCIGRFPVLLLRHDRRFAFLAIENPGRDRHLTMTCSRYRAFYQMIAWTTTIFLRQFVYI
jgi:hypothetical protein